MSCEIPLPGRGVYHLAVVTVLGHRAVIGPAGVVDSLEGFQDLHARRAGENIELTWVWSPSSPVTLAAVHWDCAGEEQGIGTPQRVTRDSYRRRGFLIRAHSCGYRFTVTPLSTITGSVSVGPPASDELEPQHDLAYVIRKTRRWLRAGRVARLQLPEPPTSPLEFLLVARPGTLRPTRMGQGAVVLRVSVTAIDTGSPAEHRIDLSAVRPPYYLLGLLARPHRSSASSTLPAPSSWWSADMLTIVCPYCFARMRSRALQFRCLQSPSGTRSGEACPAEPDEKLAAFLGRAAPVLMGPCSPPTDRAARLPVRSATW